MEYSTVGICRNGSKPVEIDLLRTFRPAKTQQALTAPRFGAHHMKAHTINNPKPEKKNQKFSTTLPEKVEKRFFFIFCLADSNSQNFFSHFILIIALLETITCGNRNYRESKHGFFKPESIFAIFREIS